MGELEKELQKMVQEKKEAEKRSNDVEAELEEAKSKYLRLNADFDNFRKRAVSLFLPKRVQNTFSRIPKRSS